MVGPSGMRLDPSTSKNKSTPFTCARIGCILPDSL